jgi:hypothetical protein
LLDALNVNLGIQVSRAQAAGRPNCVEFCPSSSCRGRAALSGSRAIYVDRNFPFIPHPIYAWAI